MSKFKWFNPFTWFQSEERNSQLEALLKRVEKLENQEVKNTPSEKHKNPYKVISYINGEINVTLHNGRVVSRANCDKERLDKIVKTKTEEDLLLLLIDNENHGTENDVLEGTSVEKQIVKETKNILLEDDDFIETREGLTFKGIPLEIPNLIVATFIELLERIHLSKDKVVKKELQDKYDALKLFWCWLAQNPIPESRRDAISFIKKNEIIIDKNGLLVLFRKVVSLKNNNVDSVFREAVCSNYIKVRKWKKSPSGYTLTVSNGKYEIEKTKILFKGKPVGNLEELYKNFQKSEDNLYTDNHTRSKRIKVGEIYREDESKIDLDNRKACSSGLHCGAVSFGFNGFGDTGVIVLVNPMNIRSVPISEVNKIRVSEMFIVGVYNLEDYKKDIKSQVFSDYSDQYCNIRLDEIKESLKNKDLTKFSCKGNSVPLSLVSVEELRNIIKNRIKKIS
jgi:hypothetical protein